MGATHLGTELQKLRFRFQRRAVVGSDGRHLILQESVAVHAGCGE
jgi:hypothetical protein